MNIPAQPPHFVTGHRSPDTDSLVSAHVFAWFLRQTGRSPQALPVRLGEAGPQALWVFNQAGVELPPLREDCRYTVGEVMRRVESLEADAPLGKALERIHHGHTDAVPVTRGSRLLGLVSDRNPKTSYLMQCNIEEMLGTLMSLADIERGLDLENLTPGRQRPSPDRLLFLDWEPDSGQHLSCSGALVVGGCQPAALQAAIQAGAAAVVLVGDAHVAPEWIQDGAGPVLYRYRGSMGSFASRLTGCFKCSEAMEEKFPSLAPDQIVSEVKRLFGNLPYSLPVVDEQGSFVGMLSARTVLALPQVKVSLVDHFERSQTILGIDEAQITEIIDHHRIGDIESIQPLRVDCRPVGSTATILYDRCLEAGLGIPGPIATLLLGALVADTLKLSSPTTTDADRTAAADLAVRANLDFEVFALEVLRQNDRLLADPPDRLVKRDCKPFQHGKTRFLAAQVETVELALLDERRPAIEEAFRQTVIAAGAAYGALMVTDVIAGQSRIILVNGTGYPLHRLLPPTAQQRETSWVAAGWVSRKKQLIPHLLERMEGHAT